MLLDYLSLTIMIVVFLILVYAAIYIHDIPYEMAKKRNHPHQDAIHYGGWLSLFTLHAIWPLLWIWSAAYREDPFPKFAEINEDTAINDKAPAGNGDANSAIGQSDEDITDSVTLLGHRYEVLDDRIERIENAIQAAGEAA